MAGASHSLTAERDKNPTILAIVGEIHNLLADAVLDLINSQPRTPTKAQIAERASEIMANWRAEQVKWSIVGNEKYWGRSQAFVIKNPADKTDKGWPGRDFDQLCVDLRAPLGPENWVAAFDGSRWYVGQVQNLIRSFSIEDVITGETIELGGGDHFPYGVVEITSAHGDILGKAKGRLLTKGRHRHA